MAALATAHLPLRVLFELLARHWLIALGVVATIVLLALAIREQQIPWRATYGAAAIFAMLVTFMNPATILS